mgnify:FL=1
MVVKDRSMEGFIESGNEELEPLLDFRDWLAEIRNDATRRMARRRSGAITHLADGSLIPGPFTMEARREILDRLLQLQEIVGQKLIHSDEVGEIKRLWAEDALRMADTSAASERAKA